MSDNYVYILDTRVLEDKDTFERWYNRMPHERRRKIDAFRFDRDKRLSLGAGILIHEGLSRAGAGDMDMEYEKNGKPFLPGHPDIFFNVSHSGYIAVCAVSDRNVGIDVERRRHFEDRLIDYVFLREEKERISADHDREYTRLWTVKESVMKYFGAGIGLGAKKIYIDTNVSISASCAERDCSALHFTQYEHEGHWITVCSEYENFSGSLEWILS